MPGRSTFIREFLEIVGSVRLGIVLLVVLAAVSATGTLVLQRPETQGLSGDLFDHYGEGPYKVLSTLGLTDVFHAPWFHAVVVLFAANVLSATLVNSPLRPARWGMLLAHVGVLLVVVGAAVYHLAGDKGIAAIMRGRTTNQYRSERWGLVKPLGFTVRLDRFETELYPGEVVLAGPGSAVLEVKPLAGETVTPSWSPGTRVTFERVIRNAQPAAPPAQAGAQLFDPVARLRLVTPRGERNLLRITLGASPADWPVEDDGSVAVAFTVEHPDGTPDAPTDPALYVINTLSGVVERVDPREGQTFALPGVAPPAAARIVAVTDDDPASLYRGPSLRVEIEADGIRESRTVFVAKPRFDIGREIGMPGRHPEIDFVYYRPDTLLDVLWKRDGTTALRTWQRSAGTWERRPMQFDRAESVDGAELTLAAVLEWKFEPSETHTGVDAALVDVQAPGARRERFWISTSPSDGARRLSNDLAIWYLASPHVRDYRGFVTLSGDGDETTTALIRVNHPAEFHGTHILLDRPGRVVTLRISRDPGLGIVYAGFILIITGVFWACFVKPVFTRRRILTRDSP